MGKTAKGSENDLSTCASRPQLLMKNSFYHFEDPEQTAGTTKLGRRSFSCPKLWSAAEMDPIATPSNVNNSSPVDEEETPWTATTLMIRNIPSRFDSDSFLAIVHKFGFSGSFDFFYIPMDFRTGKSIGYAFINFTDSHWASAFTDTFHGMALCPRTSQKVLDISPSLRQGLRDNVDLFRASKFASIVSPQLRHLKPLVAIDGVLHPLTSRILTLLFDGRGGIEA